MKKTLLPFLLLFILLPQFTFAQPAELDNPDERCPVCGMMVAKYTQWQAQLQYGEKVLWFDGVKDMMAYYFSPTSYGGKNQSPDNIYVKDYYSQNWIDGQKAIYVTGSEVLGPMGHEFIPFSSQDAAQSFSKDHKGKNIMLFDDISEALVKKMKGGHKMKHHKMKK